MEKRVSGGGGCCIARYNNSNNNNSHPPNNNNNNNYNYNYYSHDMSKMDQIMLRFRPIAPKPISGGPTTTGSGALNDVVKSPGKGKRRNNNNSGSNNNNKRRKSRSPDDQRSDGGSNGEQKCHVVTLPLLPETPDLDLSPRSHPTGQKSPPQPIMLCFGSSGDRTVGMVPAPEVVRSSVIVEGVTDTWVDGNGLGRTDEERRRRLEEDTCPGFISDGWNRVWWTNEAYRKMVTGCGGEDPQDTWKKEKVVVVRLGMREKVELPPVNLYPAFTCRVKVQYGKDGSHSMTVPCDAWRMDGGGFAWRLDVKAALSLGR